MKAGLLDIDLETHKLIESNRQSLSESQLEIVKRALRAVSNPARSNGSRARISSEPAAERRTGHFAIRLCGDTVIAHSQKDAYKKTLLRLAERDTDFLQRLANEWAGSRRIVARSHEALYPKKPGLAARLVPQALANGWYVDLNLSKDQKIKRLIMACALSELEFGKDVVVDFG
ncbi:MAG: hypothetical protein CMF74_14750 [Maricaulis sp.]|jgi:hypothetical protein|nr:hypothetical protein [Maricaulis sp.]HAQ34002.1 hypothetical protein [Alphaproteobacteria bacterium]|tara:strand:- start:101 stop:622 length:522 start_codon:yes stop_codon:yes gene_type:complete